MIIILFSFLHDFLTVRMQIVLWVQIWRVVMVSPCTRVELVNDEPQTDDQVIDHESFKGSLESETVFNAHEGTEDRKEHDHELRDNSDTDNGCFNFFEYLLLRMNYHTDEDSQQDPDKHKSIDDDQN